MAQVSREDDDSVRSGEEAWLAREDVVEMLRPVRRLQKVLLEILQAIDGTCSKHGLRYYLFYGTLLGAMRHKGFIPWDDDADVVMPRADYEKLLRLPAAAWPKGYFLQSPYSEKYGRFAFAKLRKDGTTCITPEHAHIQMHQGIFVDIFPLDEIWINGFGLWTVPRFFERMTAFSCAKLPRGMSALLPFQRIWRKVMPSPSFFAKLASISARLMSGHGGRYMETFNTDRTPQSRQGFEKVLFDPPAQTEFEGIQLNIPNKADEILSAFYGDWKMWPPESARKPDHSSGGVIDEEKDYTCYLGSSPLQ